MAIKVKCIKDPSGVKYLKGFLEGETYSATIRTEAPHPVWSIQLNESSTLVECIDPVFQRYFEEVEERNHKYVEGMSDAEVGEAIAARQKARDLLRDKAKAFWAKFRKP